METIGRAGITRKKYGPWAETILLKNEFLKRLPSEKGKQTTFEILKPLPSVEELTTLRIKHFTTTVGSLVGEAFSTFQDMASELGDWYDNLPEAFQNGDKGSEIDEAKSNFENLNEVDLPESADEVKVVFIPEYTESKASRVSNACAQLRAAAEALEEEANEAEEGAGKGDAEEKDVDGWQDAADGWQDAADELNAAADEAEGIEIPGAFGS